MSKKKKVVTGTAAKKKPLKKVVQKVVKSGKKVASSAKQIPTKKPLKKSVPSKNKPKPVIKNLTSKKQKPAAKKNNASKGIIGKIKKVIHAVKSKIQTPKKKVASKPVTRNNVSQTKLINTTPVNSSLKPKASPPPANAKKTSTPKKNDSLSEILTKAVKPSNHKGSEEKTKKQTDPAPKITEKRDDVLAISNTIPKKIKNEISPSKIASISFSITNPVKRTDSYAVKPDKEPQGKFELEFVVHASAEMLYEFLSTPSGLSEWFCDDLNIRNGIYTFIWDDQLQQARLLKTVDQQLVRFQWVDKTDGSYFEFRIQRDDLTNDISLIITDFADTVADRESSKLLWHSQVEKLMHVIGSIF